MWPNYLLKLTFETFIFSDMLNVLLDCIHPVVFGLEAEPCLEHCMIIGPL